MTPAPASARASAASKASIPRTCAWREKTAVIRGVVKNRSLIHTLSEIEEDGLAFALEDDVETVNDRSVILFPPRQQRRPALRGDEAQHRVCRVRRFVREVQPRHQVI